MSIRRLSLFALILAVPSVVAAQKGKGGLSAGGASAAAGGEGFGKLGAGGDKKEVDKMVNATADEPNMAKDLEKANPVEFLLDKKKDLKLSDAEQKEIKTINQIVKDSIKIYIKTIDSVTREFKKPGDFAPTEGQKFVGRKMQREAADSVKVRYEWGAKEALMKIAEERRQTATDLLMKERQEQMAKRGGRPPVE